MCRLQSKKCFSILLITVKGYLPIEKHSCSSQNTIEYTTIDEAKQACNNDPECTMFADNDCGSGEKYELCGGHSAVIHESSCDSVVYEKIGKYRYFNVLFIVFYKLIPQMRT